VGDPHGLQLDVSIEADSLKDVGREVLIGVVAEPPPEVREVEVRVRKGTEVTEYAAFAAAVPDPVSCPFGHLRLTDGDRLSAPAMDVSGRDPGGQLVADGDEVTEGVLEPPFGLVPGFDGRDHVQDRRASRRLGRDGPLWRRQREPGEAERLERRAE